MGSMPCNKELSPTCRSKALVSLPRWKEKIARSTHLSTPLYRDPHAPVEERVENLLALMTLDEKLAQLSCLWSTAFVSTGSFDPNTVVEKTPHGIGQVTRIGASTGLHPQA